MEKREKRTFSFMEVVSGAWPVLLAAVLASFAAKDAAVVYNMLILPRFAPPGWLFSPVWTVLYGLLVYYNICVRASGKPDGTKRRIFYINLALNMLWVWLFFGKMMEAWAIFVLLLMIVSTLYLYLFPEETACRYGRTLLLPYLLWQIFALILNISVVILNYM